MDLALITYNGSCAIKSNQTIQYLRETINCFPTLS